MLRQLIDMVKADGNFHDFELNFLESLAAQLGIQDARWEVLQALPDAGTIPPEEFQRIMQFQRLVLMSHVDLAVDSRELLMLRKFGLALGLREEAVSTVFTEMKLHPHGMIPVQSLIKIFQVYHN